MGPPALCKYWSGGTNGRTQEVLGVPVEVRTSESEPESLAERRRVWLERSRLYLVCEARPAGREPEEILRPALQGGVDVVQLRDKSADSRDIVEAGRVFRR